MTRVVWPLLNDQPLVQIELACPAGASLIPRDLLAYTGAGSTRSCFELALHEADCRSCGRKTPTNAHLTDAYTGLFPVYLVRILIPQLGFDEEIPVVAVPHVPLGFDGIACLRFLNRFSYGNFGSPDQFGLES